MGAETGENGTTTSTGGQESTTTTAASGTTNTPTNTAFTQADVDRIVADRLSREKAKFADYDDLKSRAAQWEKFVNEAKTDQEKALDQVRQDAEAQAYSKARGEFGSRLVDAHLTAAAAGRLSDAALSALLAGVNKTVFLTEAGDVDSAKVTSFIDGIAPATTTTNRPGGFGQGPRPGEPKRGLESGAAAFAARHKPGAAPPLFS
jgi:hypothetical protein